MEDTLMVAGGGTMGAGIAFVAARAGYAVELIEPDAGARERAQARIVREAERAGDGSIARRVRTLEGVPQRSQASIAIEAVPEVLELKRGIFAALSAALDTNALIATNTSALSVGELAQSCVHPERVVGLHFFNPPAAMPLVEVVEAEETSDDAVARALAFVQRIGKTPVLAADSPGFIVNRVARPFYLESLRALELGVASAEELDELARAAGFRMGPFELMDFIGLDVNLATSESIYARTGDDRLAPSAVQRKMVAQGLLGRKTGRGFYDYRTGAPERFAADVEAAPDALAQEQVVVLGYGGVAAEIVALLEARGTRVTGIERDDELDSLPEDATIVIDVGDGSSDRGVTVNLLDSKLDSGAVLFVDAYATDVGACAERCRHPERIVGYGVLGSLDGQRAVEIVDTETVSDDALALAQELFAALGKGSVLVEDHTGLFLGRAVGSIVNEAVTLVEDGVASAEDVDAAMQLGTNYPLGPLAWGREIGGRRIARVLQRLAGAYGREFAPNRALWVLDLEDDPSEGTGVLSETAAAAAP